MKKTNKSPLAAAMGVAFVSTFTAAAVNAAANPFGVTELPAGYMQLAEAGKTAEMTCGANMPGMSKPGKAAEGACAGNKTPAAAKGAEGKCGDMMDGDKMKKGMESACGAMMKGKEGKCGEMMKGESMKGKEGQCGSQCGENMQSCTDAKTKEGACGAQMKGCGEGMQGCAEMMKGKEGACAADKKAAPAAAVPATPAVPAAPAKK